MANVPGRLIIDLHPAQFEYHRDSKIVRLPEDHQWVCNASLPSWPSVLAMWQSLCLPAVYLCVPCVQKYGLRESPMRTASDEIDRAIIFSQRLENLDRKSTRLNSSHLGISYAV